MNSRARRLRRYRRLQRKRVEYCFALPTGQALPPFMIWNRDTHTATWGSSVITSEAIKALSNRSAANQRRRRDELRIAASFRDAPIEIDTLSKAELRIYCERIAADALPKMVADWNRPSRMAELARRLGL